MGLSLFRGSLPVVSAPRTLPRCGDCRLFENGCQSPKMTYDGKGERGIMVAGEAPGLNEDQQGRPFVGPSGELVRETLARHGVNFRKDCWIVNALRCRPSESNKIPDDRMIDHCRPMTVKDIETLKPKVILLLGKEAVRSVIAWTWGVPSPGGAGRWAGFKVPDRRTNAWLFPTFHPSFVLRQSRQRDNVPNLLFDKHVGAACKIKSRPWPDGPPDPDDGITVEHDPRKAALLVKELTSEPGPISFDFETETLKPHGPHARVVCCGISTGKGTVAFPWAGEAAEAVKDVLRNPELAPKVVANVFMENGWTTVNLGVKPRGWWWDVVIAAHLLDNGGAERSKKGNEKGRNVTGLKFQAYAHLGVPVYNQRVEDYLKPADKGGGGNAPNRIRELDLGTVLRYCAIDSQSTYDLARLQMRRVGLWGWG